MEGKEKEFNEPISVKDDIGAITGKQQYEEYLSDVKAYGLALENHKKDLENYKEQLDIDLKLWDILRKPGSVRKLNPTVEYEKDPQWAELMHKKQLYQIRADEARAAGTMSGFEHTIVSTEKALESAKERLEKFQKDNIELIASMKREEEE